MTKSPRIPNVYSRTKRGNDTFFINNVDGRTAIARRLKEVAASLVDNLGCSPSEGQIAVIWRAATLIVWCEDQESNYARGNGFDLRDYNTAANTLRRLLGDLGIEPNAKDITPDIAQYMRSK